MIYCFIALKRPLLSVSVSLLVTSASLLIFKSKALADYSSPLTNQAIVKPVFISAPINTINNSRSPEISEKSKNKKYLIESIFDSRELINDWGDQKKYQELYIVVNNDKINTASVDRYITTIENQKKRFMKAFKISNTEYNRLAVIAFGVLGNESQFFNNVKYNAKEFPLLGQAAVSTAKYIKSFAKEYSSLKKDKSNANLIDYFNSTMDKIALDIELDGVLDAKNSRGPTQLKYISDTLRDEFYEFDIRPENLKKPEIAALATMGFLAESLFDMRRYARSHKLAFVTEENIYDYIPYIYIGKMGLVFKGQAKPDKNTYVQKLMQNIQWLQLYEVTVNTH